MSELETLEELDPNCFIVFKKNDDSRSKLQSLFDVLKINVAFRPGHSTDTMFAFLKIKCIQDENAITNSVKAMSFVDQLVPLYDIKTTRSLSNLADQLLKSLSLPKDHDLSNLANLTANPRLAMYLAFYNHYLHYLGILSVFGMISYTFSNSNSWEFNNTYSLFLMFWSIMFMTSWIYKKENQYVIKFSPSLVPSASSIEQRTAKSSVILRTLMFIPIALIFIIALVIFQMFCFFLEIFITQVYAGPLVSIFSLVPTILISAFVPVLTLIYNNFFIKNFVNFEKSNNIYNSILRKNFVLNFFTSYGPLFITLFYYLPLGYTFFGPNFRSKIGMLGIPMNNGNFVVNTKRHQNQFNYFMVINQLILYAVDNLLPIGLSKVQKHGELTDENILRSYDLKIWKIAKNYKINSWGEFDVDANMKKLIVQIGFITMFSMIWPVAPLVLFCFNFIIMKTDIVKMLKKCQPTSVPMHQNQKNRTFIKLENFSDFKTKIGTNPWDSILQVIIWISCVICPILTFMYRRSYLPGIGSDMLEKRELWYVSSPLVNDWKTILLYGFCFEHVSIVIFMILRKLYTLSNDMTPEGIIPMTENATLLGNENITKINEEILDDGMNGLRERNGRSGQKLSAYDSRTSIISSSPSIGAIADHSKNASGFKNESNEHLLAPTSKQSASTSNASHTSTSVAGATLPDCIPTSKNYHLRFDKDGNPISTSDLSKLDNEFNTAETVKSEKHNEKQVTTGPSNSSEDSVNKLKPDEIKSGLNSSVDNSGFANTASHLSAKSLKSAHYVKSQSSLSAPIPKPRAKEKHVRPKSSISSVNTASTTKSKPKKHSSLLGKLKRKL
ncbi:hypothetical protein KAFR_0G01580 [Kazachstania africana CBS 2517]|uniref:Anoctamin transmembrane domain-containing protein n=1 Tax=Kazachstania africana (strain ATCC 22294 / BCRC 22015 / CBS 2517 / CECT 1963 / NBRC 1671 / NRRL Y-8276) TaxID=1071382 RepID=H2AXU2_KAZAF|nr:hypothetical protein KAFR_0G01580 [Kazachstania africana CBS 2517]CCF59192.1 hypothetical protein KAFR_0G01580 [Kazachstania africana CBS 2517]